MERAFVSHSLHHFLGHEAQGSLGALELSADLVGVLLALGEDEVEVRAVLVADESVLAVV